MKYNYRQYAIGSPSNRKRPTDEIILIEVDAEDCFTTWVQYDDSVLIYYDENGRIGGFKSKVLSLIIPFDIDSNNLDEAQTICRELVQRLINEFNVDSQHINIYFSGSKGYHVELSTNLFGITPTPQSEYCKRLKWMCTQIDDRIDKNLYKPHMLWRMENSKNSKSNLYKIRITHDELFNLNTSMIKSLASSTRNLENLDFNDCLINDTLESMWLMSKDDLQKPHTPYENTLTTISKIPNGVPQGERNQRCFEISLSLRSQGYTLEDAKSFIIAWNNTNSPPEKDIYKLMRTVESAYSYENLVNQSWLSFCAHIRDDVLYNSMTHEQQTMYVYLLVKLNTRENQWEGVTIKPNETIISNNKMAIKCNTSIQTVKTFIKLLIKEQRIIKEKVMVKPKDGGFPQRTLIRWIY